MISPNVTRANAGSRFTDEFAVDLGSIGAALRRRWYWVVISVVTGGLVSGLYCQFGSRIYQSETQIFVMKRSGSMSQLDARDDSALADEVLATHLQILRSPRVVGAALTKHGLDERTSITQALDDGQRPVEYVIEQLSVGKGGEGSGRAAQVVHVKFRHTSPEDSQAVLTALVDSYRAFLHETTQLPMQQAFELMVETRDELAAELVARQDEHRRFRREAPNFWKGSASVNTPQTNMQGFEQKLAEIRTETIETQAKLAAVRKGLVGKSWSDVTYVELLALVDEAYLEPVKMLVSVGSPQENQLVTGRLLQLETELIELRTTYQEDHPRVKNTRAAIDVAQRFLDDRRPQESEDVSPRAIVTAYVASLRSRLASLQSREQKLGELLREEQEKAKALVAVELKDEQLRASVVKAQQLYDNAVQQVDSIRLKRDYEGFITEILSPIEKGEQVSPRPRLFLPLGVILGMCWGLGLAVLRGQSGNKISVADDNVADSLGLPLVHRVRRATNHSGDSYGADAKVSGRPKSAANSLPTKP